MTGRYNAYSNMTSCDEVIVENYPSHWVLTRVKFNSIVKARVGWHGLKSEDFTDEGPYLVTGSDFKGKFIQWEQCYHCDEERYAQDSNIQLKNGDLLITKDGTIGKVALVSGLNGKATLNSGVFVVRPIDEVYTTQYYYWLLLSRSFLDFVDYYKTGSTIAHLYQDTFVNFKYPLPPVDEQKKIANFLDHETAKIDTLIAKQEKLIELLKEKRQAVISHAVTKGLNPDAPMKDSGVEWLGDVPAHWEVAPIKHFISDRKGSVKVGPFGSHLKNTDMLGEDVKVIAQKNVISKDICVGEAFISWEKYEELKAFTIEKGDLLITTRGTLGRTFIYDTDALGILHPCLIRLQCNENKIKPELLALIIERSGYAMEQILVSSNSTTIEVIYSESLINTVITLPTSLPEQCELLGYIEKQDTNFSTLIANAERSIELMKERKTALISAAVTGKVDVRDWQESA